MEVFTIRTVTATGEKLEHIPVSKINSVLIEQTNNGKIRAVVNAVGRTLVLTNEEDALRLAKSLKGEVLNKTDAKIKEVAISEVQAKVAAAHAEAAKIAEEKEAAAEKALLAREKERQDRIAVIEAGKAKAAKAAKEKRAELDNTKVNEASEKVKANLKEVEAKLAVKKKAKAKKK